MTFCLPLLLCYWFGCRSHAARASQLSALCFARRTHRIHQFSAENYMCVMIWSIYAVSGVNMRRHGYVRACALCEICPWNVTILLPSDLMQWNLIISRIVRWSWANYKWQTEVVCEHRKWMHFESTESDWRKTCEQARGSNGDGHTRIILTHRMPCTQNLTNYSIEI